MKIGIKKASNYIMDKLTMDYAIRSSLARIIGHDIELSSFDRDNVISSLWRWISSPEDIHQTADTDELLDLLRERFGKDAVVETGTIGNGQNDYPTYAIELSNVRFHIAKLPNSYILSAAAPVSRATFQSCRPPRQAIGYMMAFDELMPEINKEIDKVTTQIATDKMVCNVSAATGKGIVDQLIEEGLDIPPIGCIRGTHNGRVVLYFSDSEEKINSPLDHLRARLTHRFSK